MIDICITRNKEYGLVISSKVIAKMLCRKHDQILAEIKRIIDGSVKPTYNYFVQNSYINSKGVHRKEYLLTKEGFTLLMFNVQGYNEFKMAYIEKFNELERKLTIEKDKEFQTIKETLVEEFDKIKGVVKKLENKLSMLQYGIESR